MSNHRPLDPGQTESQAGGIGWIAIAIAILVVVAVVFFWEYVFKGLILARGDILLYFYPYWKYAAEELSGGHFPLWNSYLFMGAPFIANSQAGLFYPFNWLVWPFFPAHYAINASTILHVIIASLGMFFLGRRCLKLTAVPAMLAGTLFALGGYILAQIEHVNQLQGVAWLPWFLYASCRWMIRSGGWQNILKLSLVWAFLFGLQLLSGHTQTAFITIITLLIWQSANALGQQTMVEESGKRHSSSWRMKVSSLLWGNLPLLMAGVLALLITSVQLVPTLELTANSARQGGLPVSEVLSFSWHPLLVSASILPSYDQAIFTEYVTMIPIAALVLVVIGTFQARHEESYRPAAIIMLAGAFLALGVFNPLYHLLARIPPFYLFRVPARWLVIFSLGASLMAGAGLQVLVKKTTNADRSQLRKPFLIAIIIVGLLIIWRFAAVPLSRFVPLGAEMQFGYPTLITILGWFLEMLLFGAAIFFLLGRNRRSRDFALVALTLVVVSGFFISRALPMANPTSPEAYTDLRPPDSRLAVYAACDEWSDECRAPPGRLLGLSDIFFDLGDQAEMDTIYGDQLSVAAQYELTIATKHKEIIGPNLPMAFRLPAVDGFDGGLLPLKAFTDLTSLILPEDEQTFDGRLRESLDAIPEARWLDLYNARFIITDKVGDEWHEGIFFDLQHPTPLNISGEPVAIGYLPDYEATEIWVLMDEMPGNVRVRDERNQAFELEAIEVDTDLYRYDFPGPMLITELEILPCDPSRNEDCSDMATLRGVALRDSRDETFQSLTPGNYRLIHSGDVKIYENLDVAPRAFLVHQYESARDVAAARALMASPSFDPLTRAVILSAQPLSQEISGQKAVSFSLYKPEEIRLEVSTDQPGLLVLTDAHYPGWAATIDGMPTPIYPTDILFRGVMVPSGEHEVTFIYQSRGVTSGLIISIVGLSLWIILFIALLFLGNFHSSRSEKQLH